jgi:hypothetical protein
MVDIKSDVDNNQQVVIKAYKLSEIRSARFDAYHKANKDKKQSNNDKKSVKEDKSVKKEDKSVKKSENSDKSAKKAPKNKK